MEGPADTGDRMPTLPSQTLTSFARRARAARLGLGLSTRQVAHLVGIPEGIVHRLEHGRELPGRALLGALAKLYRIPAAELPLEGASGQVLEEERLSPNLAVLDFLEVPQPRWKEANRQTWTDDPRLKEQARRFAKDVFEPVREILGGDVLVKVGYRSAECDVCTVREGSWSSEHTRAVAADIQPLGLSIPAAAQLIADARRQGQLSLLDLATVADSGWLHLQAAPEGQPARGLVVIPDRYRPSGSRARAQPQDVTVKPPGKKVRRGRRAMDTLLAIGVPEIDDQHVALLEAVSALNTSLREGLASGEVEALFDFLAGYMRRHFDAEEALMREVNFPGIAEQVEDHEGLRRTLESVTVHWGSEGDSPAFVLALTGFLDRWLRDHFGHLDQLLGDHVRRCREGKPPADPPEWPGA